MVCHGYSEVVTAKVPYSIKELIIKFDIHPRQILIKGLAAPSENDVFLSELYDASVSTRVTPEFKHKLNNSHIPLRDVLMRGLVELMGKDKVIVALLDHNRKVLKKHQARVVFFESEIKMLEDMLKERNVKQNDLHFNGELDKIDMC